MPPLRQIRSARFIRSTSATRRRRSSCGAIAPVSHRDHVTSETPASDAASRCERPSSRRLAAIARPIVASMSSTLTRWRCGVNAKCLESACVALCDKHSCGMTKPDRAKVGGRVRSRREHLGLTQQELASAIGASITTINRIERGHAIPQKTLPARVDTARALPEQTPRVECWPTVSADF